MKAKEIIRKARKSVPLKGFSFSGWVVNLPSSDEFLMTFKESDSVIMKSWCRSPSGALRFNDFSLGQRVSSACQNSVVCLLFEDSSQYKVVDIRDILVLG